MRPPPLRYMLGIGPGLPYQFARCVEDAGEGEFARRRRNRLLQILAKMIECLPPTTLMSIACLDGGKSGLPEGHGRFACAFGQMHGRYYFQSLCPIFFP